MGTYAKFFPTLSSEAKKAKAELEDLEEHLEIMKMGPEMAKNEIKRFKQSVHKEQAEAFKKQSKTIGPAKDSYKYFKRDDTGVKDYNDLIKSGKAKVVEMSPREYLQRISYHIFGPRYDYTTLLENQFRIAQHDQSLKDILKAMKSGTKMYTPYLNYREKEQEGRHRAVAAMLMGMDRIPVVIVE